jgi:RND family efflux transporter MFP subunit
MPVLSTISGGGIAGSDLQRLRITDEERRPARRRRRWPWVLLAIVVVVAALAFLMRPVTVTVATARFGGGGPAEEGGSILTANGYVEARHQASVAARTTGRLAEVFVEEGDSVAAGQIVARLLDEDQRAAVARADADLNLARARVTQAEAAAADAQRRANRRAELRAAGAIGPEEDEEAGTAAATATAEVAAAKAQVAVAQAALETARLELDKTRITAPFAGAVLRKDAEVGEIVGPIMVSSTARAGAVVTIADMKTLEVGVDVNESYIARLALAMPCDVVLDAHPEVHFPAEVRAIYPSADRDKATIPVRIRFLIEDARVRPDLGAKVVVVPRVLRVPAAAVRTQDGKSRAWLVRDGKLAAVELKLGTASGDEVEVTAGLSDGDQVVVGGPAHLRAGQRVRMAL